MRAALVSVEYDDILALTLPYNRHHFEEVLVVTTPGSRDAKVAANFGAKVYTTNAFYDDGATFNKWKGFEEGLDAFGRHGLMCIMDADVMWPTAAPIEPYKYNKGYLYSPYRKLWTDVRDVVPSESYWRSLPLYQDFEFAGYTQIFWADDPHLPKEPPWHQQDWIHAGGGDSFFQFLWPQEYKIRPDWQVLHLGIPGVNWCGRATPRTDNQEVPNAAARRVQLQGILAERQTNARQGNPFKGEKLTPRHKPAAKP